MKKKNLYIAGLAALAFPYSVMGQEIKITDFEEANGQEGYTKLGVYDSWDHSPFRIQKGESKPKLEGNVKVLVNSIMDEADSTAHMLMVQRSRYGSNQFGARIDLKQTFELTTTTKYVHVMIKKDKPGRVLLMGLGKRKDRAGQSPETEQFWALSSRTILPGVWNDAVFAIKGNGGIDIHSLVVVPDCESPHDLTEDFLAYIDEIVVNDSPNPRFLRGDYVLNIDETANSAKNDRYVNHIKLTSPSAGEQTLKIGSASPQRIYRPKLEESFKAKAGETVQPQISYNGNWMNGYVYLDKGQDGKFEWELKDDHTAPENSDLVSWYYVETKENESGFNYKGEAVSGGNRNTMQTPAFKIPENLKPGFYRMRYKVDWGNVDAGGRNTASNSITSNGGSIIDLRLNIHEDEVKVTTRYQNGDVFAEDGSKLTDKKVKFGEPLTIKMVPENGFVADGITLKHGYNLDGDSLVHSTPQYTTVRIPGYAVRPDGLLTIPGEYVDGDLDILGHFKSTTSIEDSVGNYEVNFDKDLKITRTDRTLNTIKLTGDKGCAYTSSKMSTNPKTVYQDKTAEVAMITPGETITPSISYNGGPMHGYLYIDFNNNGIFKPEIGADHRPTDGSELVSYTSLGGFDSNGNSGNNNFTFPAFKVPEFLADGVYRARLKIDWDNSDPKGQYKEGGSNNIDANGGYVVDFLLNISKGQKTLTVDAMNGNVYGTGNQALPYDLSGTTTLNAVFTPVTPDYELAGPVYIKSGLNFDGPQYIRGNRQWFADTLQAEEVAKTVKIPVYGNVEIKAQYEAKEDAAYKLIFNDEFTGKDGSRADSQKWKSSKRQSSTWNRFISDSIAVAHLEDGKLVLKAIPNQDKSTDKADMLTGALESKDLFSFKYGKIEARAKSNGHTGNFPAIWLMPQDQSAGWPTCGEIDIFEQIDAENKSYHTVHSHWTYDLGHKNDPQSSFTKSMEMDRYHTYGLEWDDQTLTWFVDGKKVGSYQKSTNQSALNQGQWPFDKAFYIILNQSVGNGSWAHNADINHTYRMDVDWVRVYQKDTTTGINDTETDKLDITATTGCITVATNKATQITINTLDGMTLFHGVVAGQKEIHVQKGVYIVNNQKVMVP